MSNTVSLCMIVRNERSNIAALMGDVLGVLEEVVVVDTGSTDGTLEILRDLEQKNPNLQIKQFQWIEDFSAARNYAFSFATKDWIFWLDGDDRIDTEKLREFKDKHLDHPGVDAWLMDYIYSRFANGEPQTTLARERFIRRSMNPKWIGAIHETVGIWGMRQLQYDALKVIHNRTDKIIDPERNVRILESEYAKNPHDPRTAYYLGKELFDRVDSRGIEILEKYLALPGGRYWDDEVNARFRLGKHYLSIKKHREAIQMAESMYHLDPSRDRAEAFWLWGRTEQDLGNYRAAIRWYEWCLITPPSPPRVLNLEYYTWNPLRRLAECYQSLEDYVRAFNYAAQVKQFLTGDFDTVKWEDTLRSVQLSPQSGLVVVELGVKLREDSYTVGENLDDDVKARVDNLPFPTGSLDGAVTKDKKVGDLGRTIKPGGFLWSLLPIEFDEDFGFLGKATYKGELIHNYIRIDHLKPKLGYPTSAETFGPYRIRIMNLVRSAIKAGYPTMEYRNSEDRDYPCDVYIGPRLYGKENAKTKVLDLCELLPDYAGFGVEHADVINACSPLLKRELKKKFPDKKIINIDDHFELTAEEWL